MKHIVDLMMLFFFPFFYLFIALFTVESDNFKGLIIVASSSDVDPMADKIGCLQLVEKIFVF